MENPNQSELENIPLEATVSFSASKQSKCESHVAAGEDESLSEGTICVSFSASKQSKCKSHSAAEEDESLSEGTICKGVANMVATIQGAGILGLPFVMRKCGIIVGSILVLILPIAITFTLQLLCDMARHVHKTDSSYDGKIIAYPILGRIAYPRWGQQVQQVIYVVTSFMGIIGYFTACADIIPGIINYFRDPESHDDFFGSHPFGAIITFVVVFPLCFITRITKLWVVSAAGFVAQCLLIVAVIYRSSETMLSRHDINREEEIGEVMLSNFPLENVGYVAFVTFIYGCHGVMLPIFSELPPALCSASKTLRLITSAMSLSVILYLAAGVFGYLQFLDQTPQNILVAYRTDDLLFLFGRIGILLKLIVCIPLVHFSCRRAVVCTIWNDPDVHSKKSAICTVAIVVPSFILSLVFKEIVQIWSLAGALGGSFIVFIFPGLFWLKIVRNNEFVRDVKTVCVSLSILLGIFVLILGTQAAVVNFIDDPPSF